jgi:hypothetical protein
MFTTKNSLAQVMGIGQNGANRANQMQCLQTECIAAVLLQKQLSQSSHRVRGLNQGPHFAHQVGSHSDTSTQVRPRQFFQHCISQTALGHMLDEGEHNVNSDVVSFCGCMGNNTIKPRSHMFARHLTPLQCRCKRDTFALDAVQQPVLTQRRNSLQRVLQHLLHVQQVAHAYRLRQ